MLPTHSEGTWVSDRAAWALDYNPIRWKFVKRGRHATLAVLPVLGAVFVCITWVLLCMVVPLLWVRIQMRRQMASVQRTGGVEAMVVNVDGLIVCCRRLPFA